MCTMACFRAGRRPRAAALDDSSSNGGFYGILLASAYCLEKSLVIVTDDDTGAHDRRISYASGVSWIRGLDMWPSGRLDTQQG